MKLAELNATLACHPFFAEVAPDAPLPRFDRFRLVEVQYDTERRRFDVIVRELVQGLKIRYREIGKRDDGVRLWREIFPDPFTNEWTSSRHTGPFQIRGVELDCLDIQS
jgi:hypothetical protein